MKTYSLTEILALEKYYKISLLNNISGLKSANLIGTINSKGNTNLAIFNSVIHIGSNPPYLGFIVRPLSVERHTYENIKESNYFTINQITTEIHKKAHLTSAKYGKGVSEFNACGLTEEYTEGFSAPFVKESNIKIGLSFQEETVIKANNTILMVGKIETIMVPDNIIEPDGNLNFEEVNGVAIGGLDSYYNINRIGRYKYARPNADIEEIK